MRLLAASLGLIFIADWATPIQALERNSYPLGMLPDCIASDSKQKEKNRLFPPDLLPRDSRDTGYVTPPNDVEKHAIWKQIIERAIYNRIRNQPEFKTLGQQNLKCEIEYIVSQSGNIESPHVIKPSTDFSFDGLVIKCLRSLQNERVLNFPTSIREEKIQLCSLIVYPIRTEAIDERKAQYLYRFKSRSSQKITIRKVKGKTSEFFPWYPRLKIQQQDNSELKN